MAKKELSKETRIKTEYERLSDIFAEIDANKRKTVDGLISNAAFMAVTLQDLQAQINKEGAVIKSTNGNGFETIQEHAAQKSYNTMINRYSAVIRQLTDLAPAAVKTESKLTELLKNE